MIHHFYPRSPCGERPATGKLGRNDCGISIHALLAESDHGTCIVFLSLLVFLSTLSLRRATIPRSGTLRSTHNFYPRSPCGERLGSVAVGLHMSKFLSTLSLRRATNKIDCYPQPTNISIHALLAESDCALLKLPQGLPPFLSTLSLRRATGLVTV